MRFAFAPLLPLLFGNGLGEFLSAQAERKQHVFSRAFPAGRILHWSSAELKTEARNSSEFCEIWGQFPSEGILMQETLDGHISMWMIHDCWAAEDIQPKF